MKKSVSLLLVMVLLFGFIPSAFAEDAAIDPTQAYLAATDAQYAYELTYKLSTDPSMHDNAMGFRTAGSDAEHRAADFIAEEMKRIGLQDVEKVPVNIDKWQFNGASLTLAGTDIALTPVSYMVSGTDEAGITAQIVDCGTGFAEDYAGKDVAGKIALVGVDQWGAAWIDAYIYEAQYQGAIALVTYDIDGYGRYSDDVYQIQDVCCEDIMPTVIITKNNYNTLAAAIAAGNDTCTLIVDSNLEIGSGISYDVVGRIPGKSSDQQFIVSGHYDMYFEGFQDDCSAIACAMSIGKGIIDSGVQPENDVLIVAHGSEEWGYSGTEFDWTRGAWEMINNVHPEWAGKTLAMFNFELCGFDYGDTYEIRCVPEYRTLFADLVNAGELNAAAAGFAGGILSVSGDTSTMEDGISYRNAGVPYFLNATSSSAGVPGGGYGWMQLHYHTDSDNYTTYDERTMMANINVFGSILLHMDQNPALELDLMQSAVDLAGAFIESYAVEAGIDPAAWEEAMAVMSAAIEAHNAKIADINARYSAASTAEEKAAIRAEGKAINKKTLAAFKFVQDAFIGIEASLNVVERHAGYQNNVIIMDYILNALSNGELFNAEGTGALDIAYNLNAVSEYNYYIFDPEAAMKRAAHTDAAAGMSTMWGIGKGYVYAQTWPATISLFGEIYAENPDFTDEIAVFEAERAKQLTFMGEVMLEEIEDMKAFAALLAD